MGLISDRVWARIAGTAPSYVHLPPNDYESKLSLKTFLIF